MTTKRNARPGIISRDDVTLTDAFGTTFRLDRIDSISVRAVSNAAQIRFATDDDGVARDWADHDPIPIPTGGWTDITESVLGGFSYFQLANESAGSTSVVDIRAFCKGA